MDWITRWISENITEPLQEMIIDAVNAYIITFLESLVNALSGVIGYEVQLANALLSHNYIVQAVTYVQVLAITLLTVRLLYEGITTYILYNAGEPTNPINLLRKAAIGVAVIMSVPWIVKQTYLFACGMVDDINKIPAVTQVSSITDALKVIFMTVSGTNITPIALMLIIAFIMWAIVLFQMAVRAVTIALLMVIGSFMAALSDDLRNLWLKAVITQCLAMPVQMFLLRGTLACFALIASGQNIMINCLTILGFLWVTVKAPAFLQQFSMQTGVGSAIGGAAQQGGSMVLMRRMLTRRV